jgi:DNA-binding GntR family transcriptional regulator
VTGKLKQRAYAHIYRKLASGELPPGTRLSNRALAKEIGVSYIPVRDAISQLRNEGFIESHAGGGTFVPQPSYEELIELYDLREALECHAVSKVAESLSDADLVELERRTCELSAVVDALEQSGPSGRDPELLSRWTQADAAFHDALLRAAGNQQALRTVVNLRAKTRIFGKHVRYEPFQALRRTQEEHQRVLNALRKGDADGARTAMAEHLRNGCRLILEAHHRGRMRKTGAMKSTLPEENEAAT